MDKNRSIYFLKYEGGLKNRCSEILPGTYPNGEHHNFGREWLLRRVDNKYI